MTEDLSALSPQERAKLLLSRAGVPSVPEEAKKPEKPVYEPDLIPEIEPYEKSEDEKRLDNLLDGIDIVDAYRVLIGKMEPKVGNKKEGVMISCPMPNHADTNPSAWINVEKKTWFCGGCQIGGDVYDLAAIHFGYDLQGYKSKEIFPILREQLGAKFGYRIFRDPLTKHETIYTEDTTEPEQESKVEVPIFEEAEDERPLAKVVSLVDRQIFEDGIDPFRTRIDWEDMVPKDTFLRSWMEATTIDDLPHEFYFWLGLVALGFAGGPHNVLVDYRPVKPNFFVCLYGRTGVGKSRSIEPFQELLEDVMPYHFDGHSDPTGVKIVPTPNSGEAIIDSFRCEVRDPSTNAFDHDAPVIGLIKNDEFSGLVRRAERKGSSMREILIEMYDVHHGSVTTHSRSTGVSRARSPFCQMVSTTQPNAIHAFLEKSDVESGFLNRWIYAAGLGRIDPIPIGGVKHDLTEPKRRLRTIYSWALPGHEFELRDDPLKVWTDFFNKELSDSKSVKVETDSILSRVDLTLKKLIVCFTINEMNDQPTVENVEQAISLYTYLKATYGLFSKDISFNDYANCQEAIFAFCKEQNEKQKFPTARDIQRKLGHKFDTNIIITCIKNGIEVGALQEVPQKEVSRGRPTTRFIYLP